MKHLLLLPLLVFMTSCQTLPSLYQAAEDIADDTAIKVEVSREAISKQTDVTLSLDVKNNTPVAK